MLSLSPAKLLVILIVALVVLGPEKLPQVARQLGALWHDLRQWRSRMESEVRGAFPNLPPTHELSQAVRSPLAFLDRLADEHERAVSDEAARAEVPPVEAGTEAVGPAPPGDAAPAPPAGNGSAAHDGSVAGNGSASHNGSAAGNGSGASARRALPAEADDPNMN